MVEHRWQDRLKILQWNALLAKNPGVFAACGPAHVEQLVAHWMAAGSLAYPFAHTGTAQAQLQQEESSRTRKTRDVTDFRQAKVLSEIVIDRSALERALQENPLSLVAMLEALMEALAGPELAPATSASSEAVVEHVV